MAFPGSGVRGFNEIERRRENERILEESKLSLQRNSKAHQQACWEERTTGRDVTRRAKEEHSEAQHKAEVALNNRRRLLADLYNREREEWEAEVHSRVETPEQKKERIKERALKLQADREEERQKYIQEMYDKQWRSACNEARTLDSAATTKAFAQDRLQQMKEREKRRSVQAEEDERNSGEIDNMAHLSLAAEERYKTRIEADHLNKVYLDEQARLNSKRMKDELGLEAAEDREMLNKLKKDVEQDELHERAFREEAMKWGQEVQKTNAARLHIRESSRAQEREEDLQLLHYAVQKDKAGENDEYYKREAEKERLKANRAYLEEQMIKDAEDQSALEEIRLKEENRVWDARDSELAARDNASKRLMGEVYRDREEQLRFQALQKEEEKHYFNSQLEDDAREHAAYEEREREEAEKHFTQKLKYAQLLQDQVEARARTREAESQRQFLENKATVVAKRIEAEKVAQQAGKVVTNFPRKTSQWYT
eukprot:10376_1